MKQKAILLFLLCLSFGKANACSPSPIIPEWHARGSSIQVGYIVGERWPDYEEHLISSRGSDPLAKPRRTENRRIVRVAFTEALKGKLSVSREVLVSCSAPFPSMHARVFVTRIDGQDYLVAADFPGYEKELRKLLGKPLTTQSR